ncbi:hypothetical protein BDV11DRAFT_88422 [Aspergillus similis]
MLGSFHFPGSGWQIDAFRAFNKTLKWMSWRSRSSKHQPGGYSTSPASRRHRFRLDRTLSLRWPSSAARRRHMVSRTRTTEKAVVRIHETRPRQALPEQIRPAMRRSCPTQKSIFKWLTHKDPSASLCRLSLKRTPSARKAPHKYSIKRLRPP